VSDEIPPDLVDRMMVKCARRCCICRRYRPTKLQVHHIVERSQGGGNEEDNLIVTCLSCHSDVHTKVPFARRFSVNELKGHRDALVKMVEEGKLPQVDTDDADEVMLAVVRAVRTGSKKEQALSPEAADHLLQAVNATGVREGSVQVSDFDGLTIWSGNRRLFLGNNDKRGQATHRRALAELVTCGVLERLTPAHLEVTPEGYLAADEIKVALERGEGDGSPVATSGS
jgi:HNH endonuclease